MTEDQNCTTSCVLDGTEMLIGGQPMSAKYAVVAMLARAVTYPATYSAAADPESYQYVRTVSGSVRCVISSDETACERTSAEGFPGAPASSSGGGRWNLAAVRNDGSVVAMLARAVTYPATYSAAADPESYQYVRTVSGSVRCVISSDETACERTSAEGFPGAPASSSGGGRWNLAAVRNDGSFKWNEGNIGGAYIDQDLVLDYGRSYNIHGWTVLPNSDGTRFTNDVTGHGMFVSVQTVYSF